MAPGRDHSLLLDGSAVPPCAPQLHSGRGGSRLWLHPVLSSFLGQHLQRCSEMTSLSRDFKAGLRNLTDSDTIHFLKLLTSKREDGPGSVWEPSGLISRHLMGSFFVLIFPVKGPINPDFPRPSCHWSLWLKGLVPSALASVNGQLISTAGERAPGRGRALSSLPSVISHLLCKATSEPLPI